MYQVEQSHLLADEQYGSRKFKSAIHQCLNKCLLYDTIHFKQQPAALCSNNAKTCYDRIMPLAAVLCLCQFWGPTLAVCSMITTLYEMQHHIRTTFGDSKLFASRQTWGTLIAGIGQGNSAGPHIWAAVSSLMFDIMHSDSFYAHVITSILGLHKQLVGFAFVDDTDLCVCGPHIDSSNVVDAMQQSVDNWEGLLRATSGALVPTKCFWYHIDFRWNNNQWMYATDNHRSGQVTIQDDDKQRVTIPCLATSEARRTLGVQIAPDGNWDTEVDYLLSIAADWKVRMAAAHLPSTNAIFSLKNVVFRTVLPSGNHNIYPSPVPTDYGTHFATRIT